MTLNHPFHARKGTVGKPIAGVEVRIADDGEILVRGDNVTSGYFNSTGDGAFELGWFHTGDIGSLDAEGRLAVRGRKKEMIVTPEGLNIFPEDVERVLSRLPGVRDCVVVGRDRPHAVLVPAPGTDTEAIVRAANAELEEHQKIRGVSIWPGDALPRTEGAGKLKRGIVQQWVDGGAIAEKGAGVLAGESLEEIVARYTHGRPVASGASLDELGLSSLERVELMMAIEQRFGASVDEGQFSAARTVGDLRAALDRPSQPQEPLVFPSWNRGAAARVIRILSLATWILPIARLFLWVRADTRERLANLSGPVIFASNHQSHLDTPAIFLALPWKWRRRLAPAMAKEFFQGALFSSGIRTLEMVHQ